MTIVVAARVGDGVLLASDVRAVDPRSRSVQGSVRKIAAEGRVAVALAGTVATPDWSVNLLEEMPGWVASASDLDEVVLRVSRSFRRSAASLLNDPSTELAECDDFHLRCAVVAVLAGFDGLDLAIRAVTLSGDAPLVRPHSREPMLVLAPSSAQAGMELATRNAMGNPTEALSLLGAAFSVEALRQPELSSIEWDYTILSSDPESQAVLSHVTLPPLQLPRH